MIIQTYRRESTIKELGSHINRLFNKFDKNYSPQMLLLFVCVLNGIRTAVSVLRWSDELDAGHSEFDKRRRKRTRDHVLESDNDSCLQQDNKSILISQLTTTPQTARRFYVDLHTLSRGERSNLESSLLCSIQFIINVILESTRQ